MKSNNPYDADGKGSGWIDTQLNRFGFDDTWESWMDRIREIESPSSLGAIGPYEILREVARGGQGIVYKARRTTTGEIFALKRLIGGLYASTESRQRLQRELEAAAALDSPHIVRVFGIDIIDDQPVLAMEWVEGESITRWAAARETASHDVLSLFALICESVHHAHSRGVLHRDLKPSNIMVDHEGRPHLLDFGLAAFMSGPDDERLTQTGIFLGTPNYASPERLAAGGVFADVRSDVFALGVVLREILTQGRPIDEVRKLSADLSAVVAKATDQKPDARYQSAQALADDIRRFLAGEPLVARPPGLAAWTWRFLTRHRIAATFVITVATLLTGWAIVAGILTVRLTERTRAAEAAQHTSERINSFLMNVLVSPRPSRAGADATALSLLEYATARADKDLADVPSVRAAVYASLGRTYQTLGRNAQAAESLSKAVALYRMEHGKSDEALLQTLHDLTGAHEQLHDARTAETAAEALALARSLYGDNDARSVSASAWMGTALQGIEGRRYEGERMLREAISRLDHLWPADHPLLAAHHSSLGLILDGRGEYSEARRELERGIRVLRSYAQSESEFAQGLAWSLSTYCHTLLSLGLSTKAEHTLEELRPLQLRLYGANKDSAWFWSLAHVDTAKERDAAALTHVHTAFAAAWKLPDTGQASDVPNVGPFFEERPLAATPEQYAMNVVKALHRRGQSASGIKESLRWLSSLLERQRYPLHAAAVQNARRQ